MLGCIEPGSSLEDINAATADTETEKSSYSTVARTSDQRSDLQYKW